MPALPIPGREKHTTLSLAAKKKRGEPITMLTAYDYPTALALDRAGIDCILVGDSLGMVVLGYENTLSVTMEDMLHHCRAVARGARYAHRIGDMPFMSYQASRTDAVRNAGRFLQEAGMDAVKLEGGRDVAPAIEAIVAAGIPVMGHLGLTPQSIRKLGGWKVQATSAASACGMMEDAHVLENAGCYAVILEAIPDRVAELITQRLHIPVIGIGAGARQHLAQASGLDVHAADHQCGEHGRQRRERQRGKYPCGPASAGRGGGGWNRHRQRGARWCRPGRRMAGPRIIGDAGARTAARADRLVVSPLARRRAVVDGLGARSARRRQRQRGL